MSGNWGGNHASSSPTPRQRSDTVQHRAPPCIVHTSFLPINARGRYFDRDATRVRKPTDAQWFLEIIPSFSPSRFLLIRNFIEIWMKNESTSDEMDVENELWFPDKMNNNCVLIEKIVYTRYVVTRMRCYETERVNFANT